MVHWTELRPHRGGVILTGIPKRGHLYWWRAGQPAPDLVVEIAPGLLVSHPEEISWSGLPETPPKGYEHPPARARSSGPSGRTRNPRQTLTLAPSAEGRAALDRYAIRHGLTLSESVDRLAIEADKAQAPARINPDTAREIVSLFQGALDSATETAKLLGGLGRPNPSSKPKKSARPRPQRRQ